MRTGREPSRMRTRANGGVDQPPVLPARTRAGSVPSARGKSDPGLTENTAPPFPKPCCRRRKAQLSRADRVRIPPFAAALPCSPLRPDFSCPHWKEFQEEPCSCEGSNRARGGLLASLSAESGRFWRPPARLPGSPPRAPRPGIPHISSLGSAGVFAADRQRRADAHRPRSAWGPTQHRPPKGSR